MRYIDSDEYDEREYGAAEEESETLPCPYCGREMYADADVCPYCGSFIVEENRPRRPKWIIWTALIVLAVFLIGYVFRGF